MTMPGYWHCCDMGLQSVGESLHKYSYMQVIINNIRTNQVNIFVTFFFKLKTVLLT